VSVLRTTFLACLLLFPLTAVAASEEQPVAQLLADSLAANDLPRFELALAHAREVADAMPLGDARNALRRTILIYTDIDAVRSFAAKNPSGSFYDDESLPGLHDHLAADYPGYTEFINDFRVVDRGGRTFYPTAETVAFLIRQLATTPAPEPRPEAPSVPVAQPAKPQQQHRAAVPIPVIVVAAPPATVARSNDIRKSAKPPAVVSTNSKNGAAMFYLVLAMIAAGIVTMLVRMPKQDQEDPRLAVGRESSERIA